MIQWLLLTSLFLQNSLAVERENSAISIQIKYKTYKSDVYFSKNSIEYKHKKVDLSFVPLNNCGEKILNDFKSNFFNLVTYEKKKNKKTKEMATDDKIEFWLEQKKFTTNEQTLLGKTLLSFASQIEILKTQEYQKCRSK